MQAMSLFAGIGGFDAGLHQSGMRTACQVEIDGRCRSVLRRHFPDAVQYDDVRRVRAWLERNDATRLIRPDLLCGGFPCQDLSVAGRRAGLAGSRSGLWFTFRRIAALLRPRWLLIENVDGLRSSNGGRDLGTILRALGDMGYGWAYRVFDSQWFGLAQRRERVFIVGCLGNWRRAAEVLFERDCLPWHPAPSRQARERVAASLTAGTASSSGVNRPGRRREDDVNLTFTELGEGHTSYQTTDVAAGVRGPDGGGSVKANLIAHTLRGEGFDASEDGTGRGTPIIPIDMRQPSRGGTMTNNRREGTSGGAPGTGIGKPGDPAFTVCESRTPAIAFQPRIARNGRGQPKDTVDALVGSESGVHGDSKPHVAGGSGVSRLTPRECERLQGFPDDWTRYGADGEELSDSARYRMLGNAVSVPVVAWIARRITEADHAR